MTFNNKQKKVNTLPQVSDIIYEDLQKSYLKVMLIRFSVFSLIFILSLLIIFIVQPLEDIPSIGYTVLLTCGIVYTIWRYIAIIQGFKNKAYALRSKDIVYKTGWLWKSMITTPFNRVQHISIEQGPIERIWNLSRLKLYTAGGSTSDLSIPGLDHTIAQELKEFITRKTRSNGHEEE